MIEKMSKLQIKHYHFDENDVSLFVIFTKVE